MNPEKELSKKTKEWVRAVVAMNAAKDTKTKAERQVLADLLYGQVVSLRTQLNKRKANGKDQ